MFSRRCRLPFLAPLDSHGSFQPRKNMHESFQSIKWDYHDSMSHGSAFVRKYAITTGGDRSGTAAGRNSHDSRLQAGPVRRRDHFTCKFIGAGPHTRLGIVIIPEGVR